MDSGNDLHLYSMKIFFSFIITLFCLGAKASDTTSVRVNFSHNSFALDSTAKAILNDVCPDDSTITLRRIAIYTYRDVDAKKKDKKNIALKRAAVVKNYLLEKGLDDAMITTEKTMSGTKEEQDSVMVLIEYDAQVIEQTIILPARKKKED